MKIRTNPTRSSPTPGNLFAGRLLRGFWHSVILAVSVFGAATMVFGQIPGPVALQGTGGTITTPGAGPAAGFVVHTFTGDGTFRAPTGVTEVEVLVVGGGGGGGSGAANSLGAGGGGGGGLMIERSVAVTPGQDIAVTIGTGGNGGNAGGRGAAGNPSIFVANQTVTAPGGGGGGGSLNTTVDGSNVRNALSMVGGGSAGGGGSRDDGNNAGSGGTASSLPANSFANDGANGRGASNANTAQRAGGGGGGANANGSASPSNGNGGAGGGARTSVLYGGSYAGGGGGGGGSSGGSGGTNAGNGATGVNVPAAPANNFGGGGGGARNATGGQGGSGVVIVRYRAPALVISQQDVAPVANSGAAFSTPFQVRLVNGVGNGISGINVSATLEAGAGSLINATVATDASGFATFTNLTITGTAGTYALRFTVAGANDSYVVSNNIQLLPACENTGQSDCQYTITEGGIDYVVEVYTTTGTSNFTPPLGVDSVEYLVVAGGGGGGAWRGGGGGAGGFRTGTLSVTPASSLTVTVGSGGAGAPAGTNNSRGSSGANSVLATIISNGGGGGGIGENSNNAGGAGGSGGGRGGAAATGTQTAGAGTGGQGNNGGVSFDDANAAPRSGGGGGGAGAGGGAASSAQGGNGGAGTTSAITGSSKLYAGGGGGSSDGGGSGTGGSGGGGSGNTSGNAQAGQVNTGGGGGGAGGGFQSTNQGGAGGSGIVIVRYEVPDICLIAGQGDCTYMITEGGVDYIVEVYTTTNTSSFTAPVGVERIEYLIVGGGGPGGTGTDRTSGGGGAGGLLTGNVDVASNVPLTVTVGAGGTNNTNGGNSVFNTLTAIGGGVGGRGSAPYVNGQAGGSGGGGQHNGASAAGAGTGGQGNAGGNGYDPGSVTFAAGGGGGASSAGGTATANQNNGNAGAGGAGLSSTIAGYLQYFAGGGGGAAQTDAPGYSAGVGGIGGGGAGGRAAVTGSQNSPGAAGTANTGGGGGGGSASGTGALTGGNGGSGIVVLRYTLPQFEIVHSTSYGLCTSSQPLQITIRDGLGNPVQNYTGTVTVSNSGNQGSYSIGTGLGTLTPVSAGVATYTFHDNDNGQVILNFATTTPGTISFDVNDSVNDIVTDPDYNLSMQIGSCAFRIIHDEAGSVCSPEAITIQVMGPGNVLVTNYQGTISLSTAGITGGNWSKTSTPANANGTLTQGAPNTGAATYGFTLADGGDIVLNFRGTQAETVNFNIVAANVAQPAGIYDPDLVIGNCLFRVTHSGSSDVCSIEQVTITLVDASGNTVTNYEGTINLSTTTGFGTWQAIGQSDGVLTDPVSEDGNATYAFQSSDLGTITLGFRHISNTGPVNINVSDGLTLDARDSGSIYDQNIVIALCSFEISHGLNSNACSATEVTFRVRNSAGGIAEDYIGTMRISNNTGRGDWLLTGSAAGVLTEPSGVDTGIADYVFSPDDEGVVVLRFYSTFPAVINFDTVDGLITENGLFDPNLFYSGCFPQINAGPVCTNPGTSTSIVIPTENVIPELRSRVVLMATMQIGNSVDTTTATFNGVNMTRVVRMENDDQSPIVTTEIWAILDDALPNAGGSYTGQFNGGVGSPAICLLSVDGVEQAIPVPTANPQLGPVNSSKYTGPAVGGFHEATTVVSTDNNNAFIFSVVANDRGSDFSLDQYYWRQPQPASTMIGLWGGRVPGSQTEPPYREAVTQANATGSKTAGSAGVLSSAGILEVVEPFRVAGIILPPTMNAHVVAAFNPLVTGQPLAEDYVPVLLYETFSGALSYRAIGNTLRTLPSQTNLSVDPSVDCAMVNFATGTTSALSIPAGSTITAAYLYWSGSGTPAQADSQVSFGLDGSEVAVVADEVFLATGVTAVSADFFAAYAEVTELVSGNGTYRLKDLTVQTGNPWNTNGTCAGGWSLIVVYENQDEHLRVINLFHGFQPFQYSAFTLVPRNFRMATFDPNLLLPNGQVTHVTLEGDEQLATGNESLAIQLEPDSFLFEPLYTSFNPENGEFNSTITRPLYWLGPSGYIEFVGEWDTPRDPPWTVPPVAPGQGLNGDGYEITLPGVNAVQAGRNGNRIGESWGFDIDTHYLSHTLLESFAQEGQEAERITTRYRSGQDMVILLSEVISITNFPIADLEVFISQSGTFKVNGTGSYIIDVKNNGNGTSIGGQATGIVTVAMRLPSGMTFLNAADVSGTGWVCNVELDPGALTCEYNIAATHAGAQLQPGNNLPPITANVKIASPIIFTQQSNTRKASVRMLHNGGSCEVTPIGFIPDPRECNRSPQFDNVNDTQGDTIDIDSLVDKSSSNNNVHSITTTVTGITTNLRMQKAVSGSLETGQTGQYLLTVTNLGPDATTAPFTISDSQPPGVEFTGAAGTNWSCSTITPVLNCTFNGTLALNASAVLTLGVDVVGNAGFNVTNTVQVTVGTGNFDLVPANNAATDITTIIGPPVASQERFLLSVSTPGNATTIGGLGPFQNNDLVIYDPSTDEAVMFFDDSATNGGRIDDINAVHLLKNGHLVMSANGPSVIGTNNLAFDRWDLVRYDPILGTASLFLDGEAVFQNFEDININGVYVMDDCPANNNNVTCSVVFTTTTGGVAGSNNLSFTASDLVIYYRSGPNAGQAAIYLDGSDEDVFGAVEGSGNVNVDAFYLRVDPDDPKAVLDVFVLSVDNDTAIIGEGLDPDPFTGTIFTRDDVTELNLEDSTAGNLFLGDEELGVFEPGAAQRRIDALHLVEDGYIGHFSIRQEQGGSVCEAGVIRISKHDGLTHNRDLDYYGSVRINTSTNYGTWQLQSGSGVVTNNGNGEAVYTYDSSDQGTVVLRLVHDQVATVNISVTNGIAREIGSEDPNFSYDPSLTQITWGDAFSTSSFSNNDGSRNFSANWVELDAVDGTDSGGLGAGTGNIQIISGRLRMSSSVAAANANKQPSLSRVFNIASVPFSQDVILKLRYGHSALAPTDSMVVEARGSSVDNDSWVQVFNFTGASYTADLTNSSIPVEYNLSTILAAASQSFSESSEIRFRVNSGYQLSNRFFFIDEVYIATATDQCGFGGAGSLDHYAIFHSGFGISCVGSAITIAAHDVNNGLIDAGSETINISTSPAKGTWARVLSGSGTLTPIGSQSDNGLAQYVFAPGEEEVTLLLNYTVPAGESLPVNINVQGAVSNAVELAGEDPDLVIAEAGLVFFNETTLNTTYPVQIAGKPSSVAPLNNLLTIQGVRSSDSDPLQCVPLFADGQTLQIELAAECIDANECVNGEAFSVATSANNTPVSTDIALVDSNGGVGASAYTPVTMDFVTQPSGAPGATVVLNYSDVGQMQLHGRYNIPFGFFGGSSPDDPLAAPGYSGDFMIGSSNTFVVRPFGFAIDFPGDVGLDRADNFPPANFEAGDSFAEDSAGTIWKMAGDDFDTVVTAMAWQAEDDANNDGMPDANANLHDNRRTPNFFYDSAGQANNYRVELSVVQNQAESIFISEADPEFGVRGNLTDYMLDFADFDNYAVAGTGFTNMSYNEVGIIDIRAQILDTNNNPTTYLGTQAVTGRVNNVGRFYPAVFTVDGAVTLLPRVQSSCTPPSSFTYMGEPFGIALQLTARNLQGSPTVNYRGDFARLAAYSGLNMRAIEEIAAADNVDRSSRLENISVPVNLQSVWSASDGGLLQVTGYLAFNRADPADPDGPFDELIIAFDPTDSDGVTLNPAVLNVEIVEDTPEFFELARETFRYGRILINNAYGPETEDLAITFRVQYFDGERFVVNTDDSCTVINSNELSLLPGTETGLLQPADTDIVAAQTSTFHNGQIQGVQAAINPTDATFTAEAAGLDKAGTIDIELDLSPGGLNLPWLQFRWPHEDQDYDENPRATIEFGQFRSHDRVINWQEIYNGPTP
ncbi:MAG: DUF11 domain-containing protein [Pseudohongiella sp.]|nr:DUF11 domain-containing protein [Pseudohongiella sp.]